MAHLFLQILVENSPIVNSELFQVDFSPLLPTSWPGVPS